jgi:uncharacterized membrane protein
MKKAISITLFILTLTLHSDANAAGSIKDILNVLIKNNLLHDAYNNNSELSRKFCKAFKGDRCGLMRKFGQGICAAGGGDRCGLVSNIGQGICAAGGGNSCYLVSNIGQGICAAGGGNSCYLVSKVNDGIKQFNKYFGDRDWAWDQFYHSTGSLVWACRGIQTGQFAQKEKCYGKPRHDYRWPNK